jgi:hypothetical protein
MSYRAEWLQSHDSVYLLSAAVCLVVALSMLRRVLAGVGAVVQALAAVMLAGVAIGAALVLFAAAAFSGR